MLQGTAEEIESYFLNLNADNSEISLTETYFALEYLDSGFKIGPSYKKATQNEKMKDNVASMQGTEWLSKPEVQSFINQELINRRIKAGVTHAWVVHKYKTWADFDCTQFFKAVKI